MPESGATTDTLHARSQPEGEPDATSVEEAQEAARAVLPDLIPGSQLLDAEYPPIEYAIDPISPLRELLEWVGAHGIFKSTLALAACLCVVTGRRYGGMPVRKGKAVFITAEDSERTIAFRVRAWLESVPVGPERLAATQAIRENFYFLAREHVRGLALTLVENGEPGARAGVVARLTELVHGAVLVFLETAARLAEGNENENRVQAAFAQVIEQIAIDSGAAVGIVRHVGKQAAREGASDSYAGRGGGALSDAARSVVNFTRPEARGDEPNPLAPVVMTHAKATLSRPAQRIQWLPVETVAGVYLRPLSEDEEARANARKLLAAFPPEGLTETDIHKKRPAGLSRAAAKSAFEFLVETGGIVGTTEDRPRNKGVTVYRVAEVTR
jgi:RecA-family ATPase